MAKSQGDIVAVLSRFGCDAYGFRKYPGGAVAVTFTHEKIPICIKVDPNRLVSRVLKEKPWRNRNQGSPEQYKAKLYEQAERVTYRNLYDMLKVLLNQADSDLIDFKTLMLPFIEVGGKVIADRLLGNMEDILSGQLALPEPPKSPYDLLGVQEDAEMKVIEAAYKRKAAKAHPDRAGGDALLMVQLNTAMETIRKERDDAA